MTIASLSYFIIDLQSGEILATLSPSRTVDLPVGLRISSMQVAGEFLIEAAHGNLNISIGSRRVHDISQIKSGVPFSVNDLQLVLLEENQPFVKVRTISNDQRLIMFQEMSSAWPLENKVSLESPQLKSDTESASLPPFENKVRKKSLGRRLFWGGITLFLTMAGLLIMWPGHKSSPPAQESLPQIVTQSEPSLDPSESTELATQEQAPETPMPSVTSEPAADPEARAVAKVLPPARPEFSPQPKYTSKSSPPDALAQVLRGERPIDESQELVLNSQQGKLISLTRKTLQGGLAYEGNLKLASEFHEALAICRKLYPSDHRNFLFYRVMAPHWQTEADRLLMSINNSVTNLKPGQLKLLWLIRSVGNTHTQAQYQSLTEVLRKEIEKAYLLAGYDQNESKRLLSELRELIPVEHELYRLLR